MSRIINLPSEASIIHHHRAHSLLFHPAKGCQRAPQLHIFTINTHLPEAIIFVKNKIKQKEAVILKIIVPSIHSRDDMAQIHHLRAIWMLGFCTTYHTICCRNMKKSLGRKRRCDFEDNLTKNQLV